MTERAVLFVCLGNICRSPTAEAVMRHLIDAAGLAGRVHVESAGTGGWHAGELPDPRARAHAAQRGLVMESRARQVRREDFLRFHWVIAMDADNLRALERLRPAGSRGAQLALLRDFDPAAPPGADVPDPYYGGPEGFEAVLDQCFSACAGLLEQLRRELPR